MNKQKLFTRVVEKLMEQGEKAQKQDEHDTTICAYYLPPSEDKPEKRCGIGWIIPDGHPALDPKVNVGITLLLKEFPDLVELWDVEGGEGSKDTLFLADIQGGHDDEKVEDWPTAFRVIGAEYNLEIPEVIRRK